MKCIIGVQKWQTCEEVLHQRKCGSALCYNVGGDVEETSK